MSVTIVVGNPKPDSRTLEMAKRLAEQLLPENENISYDILDLAKIDSAEFADKSKSIIENISSIQLLIVASPVYKASYTGLLKSFLDYFGQDSLQLVPTLPVMTGADKTHSLTPRFTLTPLLEELGATCLPSTYFNMSEYDDADAQIKSAAEKYKLSLQRCTTIFN